MMEIVTKIRLQFTVCVLLTLFARGSSTGLRIGSSYVETKLPKPLSDVSASVGPDGLIYIAGGCDSPFGSQYDDDLDAFRCESVSDSFYAFDPEDKVFFTLPPMPIPRFRHAAVAVNNQIWIVGGRDADDNLVGQVVVSSSLPCHIYSYVGRARLKYSFRCF